jgi:hypothetical protein
MTPAWEKMANPDGTPRNEYFGLHTAIDGTDDILETFKQCYGMIWDLAEKLAEEKVFRRPLTRDDVLNEIRNANWISGVAAGKHMGLGT